jgi:anti-sigma factor RsiW
MPETSPACRSIEPLVTPYVDGELAGSERNALEQHLDRCPPCRARVGVEQSVRALFQAQRPVLRSQCAPGALRARCASLCRTESAQQTQAAVSNSGPSSFRRRTFFTGGLTQRLGPMAIAAMLVLIVVGAFVYRVTENSSRVLAAELTADHVKCFAMNAVLRTQQSPAAVESSLASGFDWNVHLPEDAGREGLELVGSRPCLYGEGKVAHIMYRHNGRPVSLFMLPRSKRPDQLVNVLGHEAAIWSIGDRTFVLVAREGRSEVQRMAAFVHAAMQ